VGRVFHGRWTWITSQYFVQQDVGMNLVINKMADMKQIGKRNRANGMAFELRVRKYLEQDGYFISKYPNNIDLENNKIFPAKRSRFGGVNQGFPDFIAWVPTGEKTCCEEQMDTYVVIGFEAKSNGRLDKVEKAKAQWLLKNKVFSKFFIASKQKIKNRIHINFEEVKLNEQDN